MDAYGVNARIADFNQRNGGNPARYGEWFYYANGAVRELDPLGPLIDPPENEYQRLSNIVKYHKGRLASVVKVFNDLREQLLGAACPDGGELDRLKELQKQVSKLSAELTKAEQALAGTEEGKRRELSRQADAEFKARQASFRDEVRSIRV